MCACMPEVGVYINTRPRLKVSQKREGALNHALKMHARSTEALSIELMLNSDSNVMKTVTSESIAQTLMKHRVVLKTLCVNLCHTPNFRIKCMLYSLTR